MRLLIIGMLTLAGCGLPRDIVGPVDPGPYRTPPGTCPVPAGDSGSVAPPC